MNDELRAVLPGGLPVDHFNWAQHYPKDIRKLGQYLQQTGRGQFCRLDIRLTNLEELKRAAVAISELNAGLQALALDADREPVLRVLSARKMVELARISLRYLSADTKMKPQAPTRRTQATTRDSVPSPSGVRDLDKPNRGRKAK